MSIVTTETIENIAKHINEIMKELGIESTPDNIDTPRRIARMYSLELFRNVSNFREELYRQLTFFPAKNHNPVLVKGIKFTSMCEHHWLPFTGYADVEYIPENSIIGLSKIPRVVKWFSKKPQVQENLTQEIGEFLVDVLKPRYLKVVLRDVKHSCVEARGVEAECETDTMFEYEAEKSNRFLRLSNYTGGQECKYHPVGYCPRAKGDCSPCQYKEGEV